MTTTTIAREAAPQAATLQMIRAEINVREFHRWMGIRRLQDPDHAMHCLLTECFGKPPHEGDGLAPKPFRLILPRDCPQGTLYGYGKANAEELRDAGPTLWRPGAMSNPEPAYPGRQVNAHGMDGGQAVGV